jgi:hypothetical protein
MVCIEMRSVSGFEVTGKCIPLMIVPSLKVAVYRLAQAHT